MDERLTRAEILERLDAAFRRFEATLDRLTREQIDAPNVVGVWSPKDVLAHMMYWQRLPVHEFEAASGGEPYPEDGSNFDEVNARSVAENRHKSWNALRDEFRRAHTELVEGVTALPDEAFAPDGAFEQALSDSVTGALAGNTWEHYDLHGDQLRAWLTTQSP